MEADKDNLGIREVIGAGFSIFCYAKIIELIKVGLFSAEVIKKGGNYQRMLMERQ